MAKPNWEDSVVYMYLECLVTDKEDEVNMHRHEFLH